MTPLWHYGRNHGLRALRPKSLAGDPARQLEMLTHALALFAADYDFELLRHLGIEALLPKNGPKLEWSSQMRAAAVVCSTFYARAFDRTFLGEGLTTHDGRCSPSFLSLHPEFDEVPLHWAGIGG